jgi:hypothetical protein
VIMRFWILAVVLGLVQSVVLAADGSRTGAPASAPPGSLDQDKLQQWIADLESDQYLVREQATQKLRDAGREAFDALLRTANSERLEAADRSVWLLQEFGKSQDRELAMAALGKLVRLEHHTAERWRAAHRLAVLSEQACSESLTALGAEVQLAARTIYYDGEPQRVVQLAVTLTDNWRGSESDLSVIADLEHCEALRLIGTPVCNAVATHISSIEMLQRLELFLTPVTPEVVLDIKARRPELVIHMRNTSKLGIGGETVPDGIRITQVEGGSGAAQGDLRYNDVITRFEGRSPEHFDGLTAYIAQHPPGDEVELEIQRGGETLLKTVRLGQWSEADLR